MLAASPSSPGFLWALSTKLGRPGVVLGAGRGAFRAALRHLQKQRGPRAQLRVRAASFLSRRCSKGAVYPEVSLPWSLPSPLLFTLTVAHPEAGGGEHSSSI